MKKLMTLMAAVALTFGAVTMYAQDAPKTKSTKAPAKKSTKPAKKSTKQ